MTRWSGSPSVSISAGFSVNYDKNQVDDSQADDASESAAYDHPRSLTSTRISCSGGLADWLVRNGVSLALSSYQTGQLYLVGVRPDGKINFHHVGGRARRACGPILSGWYSRRRTRCCDSKTSWRRISAWARPTGIICRASRTRRAISTSTISSFSKTV